MEESKQVPLNQGIPNKSLKTDTTNSDYKFQLIRGILITVGLSIVFFNTNYGFLLRSNRGDCLYDYLFESTSDLNKFFAKNLNYRDALIIASSFCIDIVIVLYGYFWSFFGKSWRSTIALILFYNFRFVTQKIFQMKYPEGYLWAYPGFPSIVVPYLKTNDFFFSGHVGFPIITGFEFKALKLKGIFYFCLFASFFELVTMIILRGHYSIDMVAGLIFAHYAHLIADKYKYIFDQSCVGMETQNEEKHIETTENKV